MHKRLLVCPGLTSPHTEKHKSAYQLLSDTARELDWDISILTYPGQNDSNGKCDGIFSTDTAVAKIQQHLEHLKWREANILAISAGTYLVIQALEGLPESNKLNMNILLWGPIMYWLDWKYFGPKGERGGLAADTRLIEPNTKLHELMIPIECQVQSTKLSGSSLCVASGTLDPYVSIHETTYLGALAKHKGNWRSSSKEQIEDCHHNVSPTNSPNFQAYLDLVFHDYTEY